MFDFNFSTGIIQVNGQKLSAANKLRYVIFIPNTKEYHRWKQLVVFSVYYTVVTTPVLLAFNISNTLIDIIGFVMDTMFILDLLISLRTAYLDTTGKWIVNEKEIRKTRLKEQGFWMDVVGSVPVAWFASLAAPQFQAFFRLNRLARVFKVFVYFKHKEQELSAGFSVKLLKFGLLLALYVLYCTCGWYMLGCWGTLCRDPSDLLGNWTMNSDPNDFSTLSLVSQFIECLYFVVGSISTTGYGDLYPMTSFERIFCCMMMMSGNLIVGYTMAIVTSDLANAKQRFIQIHERVISLLSYLRAGMIPKVMQSKSINFYNEYWRRNRGIDFEILLSELPRAYRTDILYMANADALRKISIFEGFSETFYRAVASQMKPKFFLPGDIIFYQNDIGHEMYTIVHGEVEVCNGDCTKVFSTYIGI